MPDHGGANRPDLPRFLTVDRALLGRLPRRNRTRRLVGSILDAGRANDDQMQTLCSLVRDTSGWHWKERGVVCGYLGQIAGDAAQRTRAARALVTTVSAMDRGPTGKTTRLACRCLMIAGLLAVAISAGSEQPGAVLFPWLWAACILPALLPAAVLSGVIEGARLAWIRSQALASLGDLALPGTLTTVSRAAHDRRRRVRNSARVAIQHILATTTGDHYGRLGAAVPDVCRLLPTNNASLLVAAIEALGRFGDGRAVAPIERAVRRNLPPDIVEAADRALAVLRLRREQEGTDARLLRPSSDPGDGGTLLRSSAGAGPGEAEVLLRAADDPDGA